MKYNEYELREKVHEIVNSIIQKEETSIIYDDSTDLIEDQILSSLSMIEVLVEFEEFLGKEIIDDSVGIRNISTINGIVSTAIKNLPA